MGFLLSFSPWIAYAVVLSLFDWRLAVLVALAAQAVVAVSLLRRHQLDLLSVGTLAFFAILSAVAAISPHSAIHTWIPALSAGVLAAISLGSLLLGRPFTLMIARRTTPQALWARPEFLSINRFLTSVWGASFTASALACALLIALAKQDTALLVAANVLAFLIPFHVTRRTVGRARARASAAGLA